MVVAGVPEPSSKQHGDLIAEMPLEMMAYTEKFAKESKIEIRLRIALKIFASTDSPGEKSSAHYNPDLAIVFDWDDTILPSTFLKVGSH